MLGYVISLLLNKLNVTSILFKTQGMNIFFRVDASIQIGIGHVMRCLTLANKFQQQGATISFICREQLGDLIVFIAEQGYKVFILKNNRSQCVGSSHLAHATWLLVSQEQDAADCVSILQKQPVDWLIVDHYAIDIEWEQRLAPYYQKLMVIDDLADRAHDCSILLDQTYGRKASDYLPWVASCCQLLLGTAYALLRPEFARWREFSRKRRVNAEFKHLLVSLGGVDKDNITADVLNALNACTLPKDLKITVIMGKTAPYIHHIKILAQVMSYEVEVKIAVKAMAEMMAQADLAIGAAGATTWERCCLGLPSILISLANNQGEIMDNLTQAGVCESITAFELSRSSLVLNQKIAKITANIEHYINKSMRLVDGSGGDKVMSVIYV